MKIDPFSGEEIPSQPWMPHVYIARCAVNEALLSMLAARAWDGRAEPSWMAPIRYRERPTQECLEELRERPFVKVGSTYGKNPSERTKALGNTDQPSVTMTCLRVPVVIKRVICYIPGEEAIEKALHARWRDDRIDSGREFFWINDEIRDLATAWREYDPMDPGGELGWVGRPTGMQTWWGEPIRSNGFNLGVSE